MLLAFRKTFKDVYDSEWPFFSFVRHTLGPAYGHMEAGYFVWGVNFCPDAARCGGVWQQKSITTALKTLRTQKDTLPAIWASDCVTSKRTSLLADVYLAASSVKCKIC